MKRSVIENFLNKLIALTKNDDIHWRSLFSYGDPRDQGNAFPELNDLLTLLYGAKYPEESIQCFTCEYKGGAMYLAPEASSDNFELYVQVSPGDGFRRFSKISDDINLLEILSKLAQAVSDSELANRGKEINEDFIEKYVNRVLFD